MWYWLFNIPLIFGMIFVKIYLSKNNWISMLTSIQLKVSELYDKLTYTNFLILAQSFSGLLPNR